MRIILIAAYKNYVLEAPLGARPAIDATDDVKNVWQSKADDYLIVQVCHALRLRTRTSTTF